jgi:hypothetical protein
VEEGALGGYSSLLVDDATKNVDGKFTDVLAGLPLDVDESRTAAITLDGVYSLELDEFISDTQQACSSRLRSSTPRGRSRGSPSFPRIPCSSTGLCSASSSRRPCTLPRQQPRTRSTYVAYPRPCRRIVASSQWMSG